MHYHSLYEVSGMTERTPFRCGVVIMASGLGTRFGSNKLLADFDGEPMVTYAIRGVNDLFDASVLVTRYEEVAALAESYNVQSIVHAFPGRNDTVRLGLQAVMALNDALSGCVFCPADQPLIEKATVGKLLSSEIGRAHV